jgi:hypothetical protein
VLGLAVAALGTWLVSGLFSSERTRPS